MRRQFALIRNANPVCRWSGLDLVGETLNTEWNIKKVNYVRTRATTESIRLWDENKSALLSRTVICCFFASSLCKEYFSSRHKSIFQRSRGQRGAKQKSLPIKDRTATTLRQIKLRNDPLNMNETFLSLCIFNDWRQATDIYSKWHKIMNRPIFISYIKSLRACKTVSRQTFTVRV